MSQFEKTMEIRRKGKVIEPLTWRKDRDKISGAMYEGHMVVEYEGFILYFDMWHHHNSEENMTPEEVLRVIELKGLRVNDKYYDLFWHSKRVNGVFLFHYEGWFRDKELRDKVFQAKTVEELEDLGLREIPCLNW